jgi:hypothetical protein
MTRIATAFSALALGAALALPAGPTAQVVDPSSWKRSDLERYLKTAAIVEIDKTLETGRSLPWRIKLLRGGIRLQAHFKHVHRPRPHPVADSFQYELAAYELSKILELDIMPPVVERTIQKVRGSLQIFVEGCQTEQDRRRAGSEPPDSAAFRDAMDEILVFELLVNDEPGDIDDTLIHANTWKICRVDFAEAFAPDPVPPREDLLRRCPRRLFERLKLVDRGNLAAHIGPLLNEAEFLNLRRRIQWMIGRIQELVRTRGETAVLYERKAPE